MYYVGFGGNFLQNFEQAHIFIQLFCKTPPHPPPGMISELSLIYACIIGQKKPHLSVSEQLNWHSMIHGL